MRVNRAGAPLPPRSRLVLRPRPVPGKNYGKAAAAGRHLRARRPVGFLLPHDRSNSSRKSGAPSAAPSHVLPAAVDVSHADGGRFSRVT